MFGITEDGQPGWKDGADTVHPFRESSRGPVKVVRLESGTFTKGVSANKVFEIDESKFIAGVGLISPVALTPFYATVSGSTATFMFQNYFGDESNNHGSYTCDAIYLE